MKGIVPKEIINRTDKSDLGALSSYEISNINNSNLISTLKLRCGDLFDYKFIEKEILSNSDENFTEIYQLYEFSEWVKDRGFQLD